jgi:hypothetical protein
MDILHELENHRDRIDAAIRALTGGPAGNGRRRSSQGQPTARRRGRRKLSAAARKRISEAAHARWAKAKKAGKNSL